MEKENTSCVTMILQLTRRSRRNPKARDREHRDGDGRADILQINKQDPENPYKPKKDKSIVIRFNDIEDHKALTLPPKQKFQAWGKVHKLTTKKDIFYIEDFISLNESAADQMIREYNINPQERRDELISKGESNTMADSDSVVESFPEGRDQLQPLNEYLSACGWKFDLEVPAMILSFFYRRAKKSSYENTYEFVVNNPLVLMELCYLESQFSPKTVFKRTNQKPSLEARIYASLCSNLHFETQRGNSCTSGNIVNGYLWNEFKDELHGKKLNDILKKIFETLSQKRDAEKSGAHHSPSQLELELSPYARVMRRNPNKTFKDNPDILRDMRNYTIQKYQEVGFSREDAEKKVDTNLNRCHYYLERIYWKELHSFKNFAELCMKPASLSSCLEAVKKADASGDLDIFDTEQKEAIQKAFAYPISAIIGGAGTGKTRVIAEIVKFLRAQKKSAIILAPSAKAALHAAEETKAIISSDDSIRHQTIHRFARILPEDEDNGTDGDMISVHEDEETEAISYDMVIVDEMSMCTLPTFSKILEILKHHQKTHLLLVGDDKQLPAIGPQFWYQICDNCLDGILAITKLEQNHRAKSSSIISLAEKVRHFQSGCNDEISMNNTESVHFYQDSMKAFEANHANILKDKDTMVLAAKKFDVDHLNRDIRELRNNTKEPLGKTGFYLHDPVITTRNDYHDHHNEESTIYSVKHHEDRDYDVYNGTEGMIESYDEKNDTVSIRLFSPDFGKEGRLVPYYLRELTIYFQPAYALTVHKAQGSQAKNVVLYLNSKDRATRSILYTAITRAKQSLYIVATKESLLAAANKVNRAGFTFFSFLVCKYIKEKKTQQQARKNRKEN